MEEKEVSEFSWSGLFTVTAACSFLFNGIIKLLDGAFSNLLLAIGCIAVFLAVANWAGRMFIRQYSKKRRSRRFVS
jgi:hypothetical protein